METGRMPRQRATLVNTRSQETRRALTRAALQLWGDGDFDAAYETSTVADIARVAGVSKGSFYFHFANKEAILLEMSSATIRAMIDQIDAGTAQDVPLHSLSKQVMTSMARRTVRGPRAAALRSSTLGLPTRAHLGTPENPRLNFAFESLLRYGKERGELGAQIDEEEGASMLTAVTMEAIARWGAGDRPASWLSRTLNDRMEVILQGIGRPRSS